jgi:hypothetical protein
MLPSVKIIECEMIGCSVNNEMEELEKSDYYPDIPKHQVR